MILSPFINFLLTLISLYSTGLFIWIILFLLIRFNVLNSYSQIVIRLMRFGSDLYDPPLNKIRKYIPLVGGIDLSPIILILLLELLKGVLVSI